MSCVPRAERILSTYRVQLHKGFGFAEAAAVCDYLAALGISHLYASPYFQAEPGSTHGYDVVDHQHLNEELGGEDGHARLLLALREAGLGQVLDIVPNHMAVSPRNGYWWDVLENGQASRCAAFFDVDWAPPEARLRDTVLLPVLGDQYGRVLESGGLRLVREGGSFCIAYGDQRFPVAPRSLDRLLLLSAVQMPDASQGGGAQLAFLADAFSQLPPATALDHESTARRHRDKEVLRTLLQRLLSEDAAARASIDTVVAQVNDDVDTLDALLSRQNYRLAYWRSAGRDLGYRRFFDVNSLVGLRTEDPRVFDAIHARVLAWMREGALDGLRVDHPDGLRDPEGYLRRLHQACEGRFISVEKILMPGESLPETWPVSGTTGYDFLTRVLGLFIDPTAEGAMTQAYAGFSGEARDFSLVAQEGKRMCARELLGGDINRLASLFLEVCERHRRHRDFTRHELHELLQEFIAAFPVYRAYVRAAPAAGELAISPTDEAHVQAAIAAVRVRRPDIDAALLSFLGDLMCLRVPGEVEGELVMRVQQLTGPAMAKGVEDTAFYRYHRLIALCEVGGDPGRFGTSLLDFHQACAAAQARWPAAMLATSTHDTKRSEDVRARLALLSEVPAAWAEAARRFSARAERHRRAGLPDRNIAYLYYQTLVGAWPLPLDRALAYMEKAAREAKLHTSWLHADAAYEDALRGFVTGTLGDKDFVAEVEAFVAPLIGPGRTNSLAQVALKLTAPGVPDFYQGSELWDLSLVDPDNRRPVDYAVRRRLLAAAADATPEEVMARADEGLPKLWLIHRGLLLRKERREAFGPRGGYAPLAASGAKAEHVVAFCRGGEVVTVVPRLVLGLGGDAGDTTLELPAGSWRDVLSGEQWAGTVAVAALWRRFPVALLQREG